MATVFNQNNQDEEENQSAAPVVNSGQSSFSNVGNAFAPQSKPTSSGARFTNIRNYLDANKGNNLGSTISDKIKTDATKLKEETNKQQTAFNNEASKVPQQDDDFINSVNSGTANFADQNVQSKINAYRNASFNLQGLDGNLNTSAADLKDTANSTQSEEGRFKLLTRYFNKPNYTKGQQSLDQLLLQTDPNQVQAVTAAGQEAVQQADTTNQAVENAMTQASTLASNARSYKDRINAALGQGLSTFGAEGSAEAQAAKAENERAVNFENLMKTIDSGEPLPIGAQMLFQQLGFDMNDVKQKLHTAKNAGINPSSLFAYTPSSSLANWQDKLTPERRAAYNALLQIQGMDPLQTSTYTPAQLAYNEVAVQNAKQQALANAEADKLAGEQRRAEQAAAQKAAKLAEFKELVNELNKPTNFGQTMEDFLAGGTPSGSGSSRFKENYRNKFGKEFSFREALDKGWIDKDLYPNYK